MICVPRHSNPSGEVYSDNNILEIFEVSKNYSEDFLILFDNAYLVHDFLPTRSQSDVWKLAQQVNAENNAVVVTSFSKVTFGGGGLSFLAASGKNLELIKRMRALILLISSRFLPDAAKNERPPPPKVTFEKEVTTTALFSAFTC